MSEKVKKKEPPKGCMFGCLGVVLFIIIAGIIGVLATGEETQKDAEKEKVEGIIVDLSLVENIKKDDKSVVNLIISNTTEKTFKGYVTTRIGMQDWTTEVESLVPGEKLTRQVLGKYVKNPEDGFFYGAFGSLTDSQYLSAVKYEIFNTDLKTSYNVKMDEINEENVTEVMKELYSKYGSSITYVGFYNTDISLEDMNLENVYPEAEYFGNLKTKEIIINGEKFDFKPQ